MNVFELFVSTIAFFALPSDPSNIFLLIFSIFLVFGSGSLLMSLGHDLWLRRQLQRRGRVVEGQAMRQNVMRGYKWGREYSLTCRYSYNGQTFIKTFPDSIGYPGKNVQIRLLPESPEKARVIESGSPFGITYAVLGIYGIALGVLFLVVSFLSHPPL
jgi:Protein of unknown function (DUF3592)